eukprot:snap_masked-scaffold_7-processed-gene-14.34-mRNA-1 protein AED:0.31 eAED:0.35 QI:0/-1/0/1/-1/1/1/0/101
MLFSFAERLGQYENTLSTKKYNLILMNFHTTEFVLDSKPKLGSKVNPQWIALFQIIRQLGSYLYLLKSSFEDEEEVHASRMMFYATSHFFAFYENKDLLLA